MGTVLQEVEVVGDVKVAPSAVIKDGLVSAAGNLTINIDSFYYEVAGLKGKFAGVMNTAVTDNATNYVFLDSSLDLTINTTGFPADTVVSLRLAKVVASGGVIIRVSLERAFLTAGAVLDGYLTAASHKAADDLTHIIAEDGYTEIAYDRRRVTSVITWTDSTKTTKIRGQELTYTGRKVTTVATIQYNSGGDEVERITETLTYQGGKLIRIDTVLT